MRKALFLHRSRGQTLVEGALVMAIFLVLVMGAVDLSLLVFARAQAQAAAREAARLGAVIWRDPDADGRVRQRAQDAFGSPPGAVLQGVQVSYPEGRTRGASIAVQLLCRYRPFSPGIGVVTQGPCSATAVMRLE